MMADKERYMSEEEKLKNVPNAFPIDTTDNSHDNESKAGKQISDETAKGTAVDLSDEPADATEGHVEPRTEFDNGVNVPIAAKVPNNIRGLNSHELSEGETPKTSLKVSEADTAEEKAAVRKANSAPTTKTKVSVSK